MRRKKIWIPALAILLTVFFFKPGKQLEEDVEIRPKANPASDEVGVKQAAPARGTVSPGKTTPSITKSEINSLRDSVPDKMEVKEEAAGNPHTTPKSLIVFAEKLGSLMGRALHNVEDAKMLEGELHNCVVSEKIPDSARTFCLSSAEKLAAAHPELKEKMEAIRAETPPKVIQLNEKVKKLRK